MTAYGVVLTLRAIVNSQKLLFIAAAVWEILRFTAIFFLFSTQPLIMAHPTEAFNILWFGSVQLVFVAGFTFVGFYPQKYASFVSLLRLGKIIALPTALLVILTGGFASGTQAPSSLIMAYANSLVPVAVFVVDLIILVLLLRFRPLGEE